MLRPQAHPSRVRPRPMSLVSDRCPAVRRRCRAVQGDASVWITRQRLLDSVPKDFVVFVVVDCGADSGGFPDHRGGAARDQTGCADVLNRNPASFTLLLSNGRQVDVPAMEQLHSTLATHVPHRVKQLLNEGAGHSQPCTPLAQRRPQINPTSSYPRTARALSRPFCSRATRARPPAGCVRCRFRTLQSALPRFCECAISRNDPRVMGAELTLATLLQMPWLSKFLHDSI